jgi:hypothetical protein
LLSLKVTSKPRLLFRKMATNWKAEPLELTFLHPNKEEEAEVVEAVSGEVVVVIEEVEVDVVASEVDVGASEKEEVASEVIVEALEVAEEEEADLTTGEIDYKKFSQLK